MGFRLVPSTSLTHHLTLYSYFRACCIELNEDRPIYYQRQKDSCIDFSDVQVVYKFAG